MLFTNFMHNTTAIMFINRKEYIRNVQSISENSWFVAEICSRTSIRRKLKYLPIFHYFILFYQYVNYEFGEFRCENSSLESS